jgi:hypothetical protein
MTTTYVADKGVYLGKCNRTACPTRPATWWNRGTLAFYCPPCAVEINKWGPPGQARLCTKGQPTP